MEKENPAEEELIEATVAAEMLGRKESGICFWMENCRRIETPETKPTRITDTSRSTSGSLWRIGGTRSLNSSYGIPLRCWN